MGNTPSAEKLDVYSQDERKNSKGTRQGKLSKSFDDDMFNVRENSASSSLDDDSHQVKQTRSAHKLSDYGGSSSNNSPPNSLTSEKTNTPGSRRESGAFSSNGLSTEKSITLTSTSSSGQVVDARSRGSFSDDNDDEYYSSHERQIYEQPKPQVDSARTIWSSNGMLTLSGGEREIQWQRGQLIGSGSFGAVYQGFNTVTGELFAVKQISLLGENDESSREIKSLEQEVSILKQLQHDNIVQYFGTSFENNYLNIFLEYIPGGSISSLLKKFGGSGFSEELVINYARQILAGLEYLHRHQIVHRDIKGANILVTHNGVVKLADFGASKRIKGLISSSNGPQSLKGTVNWMAPEVARQKFHGRKADMWSFGCTLIEMLTGKPPWNDSDQVTILYQIAASSKTPPIPSHISSNAKEFLTLSLQREPRKRPTAAKLLEHPFIIASTPVNYLNRARVQSTPPTVTVSASSITPPSPPSPSNSTPAPSTMQYGTYSETLVSTSTNPKSAGIQQRSLSSSALIPPEDVNYNSSAQSPSASASVPSVQSPNTPPPGSSTSQPNYRNPFSLLKSPIPGASASTNASANTSTSGSPSISKATDSPTKEVKEEKNVKEGKGSGLKIKKNSLKKVKDKEKEKEKKARDKEKEKEKQNEKAMRRFSLNSARKENNTF